MSDTHVTTASPIEEGRRHQIFPTLNETQYQALMQYGSRKTFDAGEILFQEGQRHTSMFVLINGEVAIERNTVDGPHLVTIHRAGEFTGEVGTLAGRASIATGRALTDCDVLEITEESLRVLVIAEAELSETIMRGYILRRVQFMEEENGGVILIGAKSSADTLRVREFLSRNAHAVAYFDVDEHPEALKLLSQFGADVTEIPVLINSQSIVIKMPTNREVADLIGLSPDQLNGKEFDLVVIGAGPAGLASAVYASSEGLKVLVLDAKYPGGQAGSSSKIENYFGFPTGISGQALAGRGITQARKFGAEVAVPVEVSKLTCRGDKSFQLQLDNGEEVFARAIIIATGARYRKPSLPNLEQFEGRGIFYGASFMEATFCANQEVIVVGGGNSAGQAAVFLAAHARRVHIVVRGPGLATSMSHYLIQRIEASSNIDLHIHSEITGLVGKENLEMVQISSHETVRDLPVANVFMFLGAEPNTTWLGTCVRLDDKGFVLTGLDVQDDRWKLTRPPYFLETSHPGIFAVGDVRSASVKRVATAVGEGASAIQSLHAFLASLE